MINVSFSLKLGQANRLHFHDSDEDAFEVFQEDGLLSASRYPWNTDAFPPPTEVTFY